MKSSRIIGSKAKETSTSNTEIIPDAPANWTMPIKFKKFSFMNNDECTLVINGEEIFLQANQGFASGYDDAAIESVKIKESGVIYNWVGAY